MRSSSGRVHGRRLQVLHLQQGHLRSSSPGSLLRVATVTTLLSVHSQGGGLAVSPMGFWEVPLGSSGRLRRFPSEDAGRSSLIRPQLFWDLVNGIKKSFIKVLSLPCIEVAG